MIRTARAAGLALFLATTALSGPSLAQAPANNGVAGPVPSPTSEI